MSSKPTRSLKDVHETIDALNEIILQYVDRLEPLAHLLAVPKIKHPLTVMERVAFDNEGERAHIVGIAKKHSLRACKVAHHVRIGAEYLNIIDANYNWNSSTGAEYLASEYVALLVERIAEYHDTIARELSCPQALDSDGYAALAAVLQGQVIQMALHVFESYNKTICVVIKHAHGERYDELRNMYLSNKEAQREAQVLLESTQRMAEQCSALSEFPPITTLKANFVSYWD